MLSYTCAGKGKQRRQVVNQLLKSNKPPKHNNHKKSYTAVSQDVQKVNVNHILVYGTVRQGAKNQLLFISQQEIIKIIIVAPL